MWGPLSGPSSLPAAAMRGGGGSPLAAAFGSAGPGDFAVAAACLAIFAAGLWIFNRISPHFEDFL